MTRSPLLIMASVLAVAGCTSTGGGPSSVTLTEGGTRVVVAQAGAVAACERLGEVEAPPPFVLPGDASNTLRNKAGALGANTVVVTSMLIGTARAEAYRCRPA